MTRSYFVTGTDTGVGKTLVTAALLRRLRESGVSVAGMKPIAAGSMAGPEGPANEDALLLQAESSVRHPYATVNPWLFAPAIAPHIAAEESGVVIDTERIVAAYERLRTDADVVLAEGAGGFLVPLDADRSCAELPALLGMDVILVVGLRLGCLNHALLTVRQSPHAASRSPAGSAITSIRALRAAKRTSRRWNHASRRPASASFPGWRNPMSQPPRPHSPELLT